MPRPVFNIPENADKWFWPKVDKSGECWIWTAGMSGGYGMASMNRRLRHAHSIAWELINGAIPDGLDVLHDCPGGDNKACVNPSHLWLGTQSDNTRDWYIKSGPIRRTVSQLTRPKAQPILPQTVAFEGRGWAKKNRSVKETPAPYAVTV